MVDRFEKLCHLSYTLTETVIAMDDFLDLVDFAETDPILGISLEDLQRLNQSVETLRDLQERCMQARAAVKATLVVVAPAPNTPEPGPTDPPEDN